MAAPIDFFTGHNVIEACVFTASFVGNLFAGADILFLFLDSAPEPKVIDSILGHIGNTPMVRLDRIAKAEGLTCELCTLVLSLTLNAAVLFILTVFCVRFRV